MRYDPKDIQKMPGETGRLLRCIQMAMGCLSPLHPNEKLAWLRLLDAIEGREPRKGLNNDS